MCLNNCNIKVEENKERKINCDLTYEERLEEDKTIKERTLKAILKDSEGNQIDEISPLSGTEKEIEFTSNEVYKSGTYTIEIQASYEVDMILDRFFNDDTFTCAFLTSCYTGMRTGEVCALTWDDIDLENKTLTVNKNVLKKNQNLKNNKKVRFVSKNIKKYYKNIKIILYFCNISIF